MTCDATNYGVMFTKSECPHDCSGHASNTYISGKVYDPAGKRTIYGAVVYIRRTPARSWIPCRLPASSVRHAPISPTPVRRFPRPTP